MSKTLVTLIETAIANRRTVTSGAGCVGLAYMSSAVVETSIGKIVCFVDFTHRNANSNNKHIHVRFDLNGKRAKRAELAKLLND